MTEPRRRSDFSIKRFCPESPGGSLSDHDTEKDDFSPPTREYPPDTPETSGTPDVTDIETGDEKTMAGIDILHRNGLQSAAASLYRTGGGIPVPTLIHPAHQHHPGLTVRAHPVYNPPVLIPGGVRGMDVGGMVRDMVVPGDAGADRSPDDMSGDMDGPRGKRSRKNYKNMTRERRVEANARERSRVHTISAAFESLRRAVPSYSYNQKLSKLAILRIACSYILALARLADDDYTDELGQKDATFSECVDLCTKTIQTEGRARRRH